MGKLLNFLNKATEINKALSPSKPVSNYEMQRRMQYEENKRRDAAYEKMHNETDPVKKKDMEAKINAGIYNF